MNSYDEELMRALASEIKNGAISVIPDSALYFSRLSTCYPYCGSKIDWALIRGAIELRESSPEFQVSAFLDFFYKTLERNELTDGIIYIADGLTNVALIFSGVVLPSYLREIFSIPQHHYFIAKDFSWCMVFSFEGDMCFAYRDKC